MFLSPMSQDTKKLIIPTNREAITREPEALQGKWTPHFPDALSFKSQGGGHVPADFRWRSSPKQEQEEFSAERQEVRKNLLRAEQAPKNLLPGGK